MPTPESTGAEPGNTPTPGTAGEETTPVPYVAGPASSYEELAPGEIEGPTPGAVEGPRAGTVTGIMEPPMAAPAPSGSAQAPTIVPMPYDPFSGVFVSSPSATTITPPAPLSTGFGAVPPPGLAGPTGAASGGLGAPGVTSTIPGIDPGAVNTAPTEAHIPPLGTVPPLPPLPPAPVGPNLH